MNQVAYFDVYGYRFVGRGSAELVHAINREFAHFLGTETSGAVEIIGRLEEPSLDATVHSARNISYSQGGSSYIDYHGRALAKYETASGRFEVSSLDADLIYQLTQPTCRRIPTACCVAPSPRRVVRGRFEASYVRDNF